GSPLVGDVEVFAAVDPFGDAVEGGAEVGAGVGFGGLFRGFGDLVELVFVFGFAGDGEGVEVFPCGDAQYDVAFRPLFEPAPVSQRVGDGGGAGPGSFFAGFGVGEDVTPVLVELRFYLGVGHWSSSMTDTTSYAFMSARTS